MNFAPVPTQMFNEEKFVRSSAGYLFTAIPAAILDLDVKGT